MKKNKYKVSKNKTTMNQMKNWENVTENNLWIWRQNHQQQNIK